MATATKRAKVRKVEYEYSICDQYRREILGKGKFGPWFERDGDRWVPYVEREVE